PTPAPRPILGGGSKRGGNDGRDPRTRNYALPRAGLQGKSGPPRQHAAGGSRPARAAALTRWVASPDARAVGRRRRGKTPVRAPPGDDRGVSQGAPNTR